jgi:hypothetical protein
LVHVTEGKNKHAISIEFLISHIWIVLKMIHCMYKFSEVAIAEVGFHIWFLELSWLFDIEVQFSHMLDWVKSGNRHSLFLFYLF